MKNLFYHHCCRYAIIIKFVTLCHKVRGCCFYDMRVFDNMILLNYIASLINAIFGDVFFLFNVQYLNF